MGKTVIIISLVILAVLPDCEAIHGSTPAKVGQFPYVVRIAAPDYFFSYVMVHGALYTRKWIIAYKDLPNDPAKIFVIAGYLNWRLARRNDRLRVKRVIVHEKHDKLSLLELVKPIKLSDSTQTIPLYRGPVKSLNGAKVVYSSWGAYRNNDGVLVEESDLLRYDQATLILPEDGSGYYSTPVLVHEHGHGTCDWEYGLPVVSNSTLVGFVYMNSRNAYCGLANPDNCFLMPSYVEWIEKTAK